MPILLTGPQRQLDAQGPVLVKELTSRSDVRTLSAWDAGEAGAALRPSKTEAMIVASVARSEDADGRPRPVGPQPGGRRPRSSPVRAHISGQPTLDQAIEDEALHTARVATLLALPILFLALLIVLRAPIAALITTAFGGVTAFVGFGVMAVVGEAVRDRRDRRGARSVMGLALGTGPLPDDPHALPKRGSRRHRVRTRPRSRRRPQSRSTGRAVLIAGTGLFAVAVPGVGHWTDRQPPLDRHGRDRQRAAGGRRGRGRDAGVADAARRPHASPGASAPRACSAGPWRWLAAGRPVLRRAVDLQARRPRWRSSRSQSPRSASKPAP